MRNINWSKWIAIALSIFIVTQFIQVSFLAAGQIESSRSDAGADASRGSLAEGIYQDVWEKVGDGDMILSARADGGKVAAQVNGGTDWNLTGQPTDALTNLSLPLEFALLDGQSMAENETFSFSLPENFTAESADVSFGNVGTAHIVGGTVDVTVNSLWVSGTQALTISSISYNGTLEAHTSAEDTSVTQNTWAIVDNSTLTVSLPKTAYVETEPASDPEETPATPGTDSGTDLRSPATPATTATISILVQDAAETPVPLSAGTFLLQRSETEGGEFSDYATINVNATTGADQAIADGYYQLTQTAAADEHTALAGAITFSVSGGVINSEASGTGWAYSEGAFTVTNAAVVRLRSAAPPVREATVNIVINRSYLLPKLTAEGAINDNNYVYMNGVVYKIYNSTDMTTPVKTFTATDAQGMSSTETVALTAGTYYVKEESGVNTDKFTGIKIANIKLKDSSDQVLNPDNIDITSSITTQGYVPFTVTTDGMANVAKIEFILSGYRKYEVKLVNGGGTEAVTGKAVTFSQATGGTATAIWASVAGMKPATMPTGTNTYSWTARSTATTLNLEGVLVGGVTYAATIAGNTNPVTFSVNNTNGDLESPTPSAAAAGRPYGEVDTTDKRILTLRQPVEQGIEIQLKDGTANMNGTGANYTLYPHGTTTGAISVTFANGKITAAGLAEGSYDLYEQAAPTGYTALGNASTKLLGTISISSLGAVTYPSGTEWTTPETNKAALTYTRKNPTLTLNRSDATTAATAIPNTLTYTVYSDAAATTSTGVTVDLTKGADKATGTVSESTTLAWNTPYYIKETTADYTGKDASVHGPYTFSPTMTNGTADTTTYTATPATMTIAVTIAAPSVAVPVDFKYLNASGTAAAGTFTIKKKNTTVTEDTITLSTTVTSYTSNRLYSGFEYTVTQTSPTGASLTYDFVINQSTSRPAISGTVTGGNAVVSIPTTGNALITMSERVSQMRVRLDICTAEDGYDNYVDEDDEILHNVSGVVFQLFENATTTTPITFTDNTTQVATDSDGYITVEGLDDGTYYLKCKSVPSENSSKQLAPDTTTKFAVTMANGAVSNLAVYGNSSSSSSNSSSSPKWTVDNGHIRAYLKRAKITLKANSDKTFYIYRLTWGSGADDEREATKLSGGVPDDITNATKGSDYVTVASLGDFLKSGLTQLDSLFVMRAKAAESAKIIQHGGYSWQLIGSKRPGKGSTGTFDGLIAGQPYLIREGSSVDPESSDPYYLIKKASTSSQVTSSTASTGNSGSTIRSGAATTASSSTGAGTKSGGSGSAGGGRGAATGDGNDLWMHLIVMLIAFDALVADLLYISRKKQPLRSR